MPSVKIMKVKDKKNYLISRTDNSFYCERDDGKHSISAYPTIGSDYYHFEFHNSPAEWAIKWFKDYLKEQGIKF